MYLCLYQVVLAIGFFPYLVTAGPIGDKAYVSHEKRRNAAVRWTKRGRIDRGVVLPVRIGLAQNNLEKGHSYLMDVSDPKSPNYAKYWTMNQVHEAFAPSKEAVEQVIAWLDSSGISTHRVVQSENKGWLVFDARTHELESLLHTELHQFHHENGEVRAGTDEYHVPSHIQGHIDYIIPGVKLSTPMKKRTQLTSKRKPTIQGRRPILRTDNTQSLANCGTEITPSCVKALYEIPDLVTAIPGNTLGIYEDGDYYDQQDLNMFFARYAPQIPQNTSPIPAFIDGGMAPVPQSKGDREAIFDIGVSMPLIYPQQITLYQTDDSVQGPEVFDGQLDGELNTFLDGLDGSYCNYTAYNITGDSAGIDPIYPDNKKGGYNQTRQCGIYQPTNVISISIGEAEVDLPVNYQKRQCNEFLKLGLQGVTILVTSGDFGVAANPGDGGTIGCLGINQTIFSPETPTCPYVTSVGATQLNQGQSVSDPESAMEQPELAFPYQFGSSGGFSNIFDRPQYQDDAVGYWLDNYASSLPFVSYDGGSNIGLNNGTYNSAGRAIPDVSANGANFMLYVNGILGPHYGTSLAAPIWGSIITLVNEARITAGKASVGFINPVLYQNPQVFNDITNGSNPGCHSIGFNAVTGWDPITGLGTPVYPSLEKLFLSLP